MGGTAGGALRLLCCSPGPHVALLTALAPVRGLLDCGRDVLVWAVRVRRDSALCDLVTSKQAVGMR
jgi:hypothetical protein